MVQSYSCAESPFWLAKAFLCLYFPKDHPFWIERNGAAHGRSLGVRETGTTVLDGQAVHCNHGANGTTEDREGGKERVTADVELLQALLQHQISLGVRACGRH